MRVNSGKTISVGTMMHSETGEAYKMNTHHSPLRQIVEETRLGKENEEGGHNESERREGEV
jgi:hypothetical protein